MLISGANLRVSAQEMRLPGVIDMQANMNATINGMIDSARFGSGSRSAVNNAAIAEVQRRAKIGKAIINAGKATTRFNPSLAGTKMTAQNLKFDATEPQDLAGQIRLVQNYVKRFNELMTKNGLTPNDFSDGYALSYALSYIAYYDEPMNPKDAEQMRQNNRQGLLKSAFFQGSPAWDLQTVYETNALMAMQAIDYREKARSAKNRSESSLAEGKAKEFANYKLKLK